MAKAQKIKIQRDGYETIWAITNYGLRVDIYQDGKHVFDWLYPMAMDQTMADAVDVWIDQAIKQAEARRRK